MFLNGETRIIWITRTAAFVALLVVLQFATAPFGNPLVTGAIVNMLLIVSVMTCGLTSGLTVAIVSPVMAKLLGIGPLWSLIPFIMVGNMVLVMLWYFIGNRSLRGRYVAYISALFCGAVAKFLVLYIGIVRIAVPILLELPGRQAAIISNMFSISQLITAFAGGLFAILLFPRLKKAMENKKYL